MKETQLPISVENKTVENLIYEVRGMHVMLDSDVAFYFGVETRILNQAMKRNQNRFPSDFCFKLNSKEFKNLRSQNVIFRNATNGRKYAPYMYSEHGIITLAGVLKSDVAAAASIEISRKFIEMRKTLLVNSNLILMATETKKELLEFENKTNQRFDELYRWKESKELPKEKLISEGKYYDAFEFITTIIREAKSSIVLVDPYCDSKALIFLNHKNKDVKLTIFKGIHSKLKDEEIKLFETQNGEVNVINKEPLHDRFIIIDQTDCFLLGSSLNHAGKSLLTIIKLVQDSIKNQVIHEYPI